jgi:hypothetical protein
LMAKDKCTIARHITGIECSLLTKWMQKLQG